MKMMDLTDQEREFLDKVAKYNRKNCDSHEESLWNVCRGYLKGIFDSFLFNLPDDEIERLLKLANDNPIKYTKCPPELRTDYVATPASEKKGNSPLF